MVFTKKTFGYVSRKVPSAAKKIGFHVFFLKYEQFFFAIFTSQNTYVIPHLLNFKFLDSKKRQEKQKLSQKLFGYTHSERQKFFSYTLFESKFLENLWTSGILEKSKPAYRNGSHKWIFRRNSSKLMQFWTQVLNLLNP